MARHLDTRGVSLAKPANKDEVDNLRQQGPYGSPDETFEECVVSRPNGSGSRTTDES